MDNEQQSDHAAYVQAYGQAREPRDFGLSFVSDSWLEEHLRQQGSN